MKIAVFTDSYRPYVSGVVRSIETFTEQLLALGHEVYIFAPRYYRDMVPGDPSAGALGGKGRQRPRTTGEDEPTRRGRGLFRRGALARGSVEGSGPLPETTGSDGEASPGFRVFRYWSVPVPTYAGFALPLPISPAIDHVIDRLGIDIVHTHTPFLMGKLGALVARRRRLPLVFTHHTLYHEYVHYVPAIQGIARRLVLRHLARYCRQCQLIIAPTPQIRRFIARAYRVRSPIVSISTGIDLAPFERGDPGWLRRTFGIGDDRKVLLFVGRLGREKNVDLLLDAFEIVADVRPDTVLVMVGDGPERARLQEEVRRRGLVERVVFTGTLNKERVVDAYLGSDLFFFASVTETQGLVTLEAMAAGLPVAAVDAPGTRDMVQHGRQGLLSDPNPSALARQAVAILADPDLMRRLRVEARERARQFTAREQTLRLLAAYQSVLVTEDVPGRKGENSPVSLKQECPS